MNHSVDQQDAVQPSHGWRFAPLSEPLAWLSFAVIGLLLVCGGVALDVHRHKHGANAAELISFSSPGILIAVAGAGIAAAGVLAALSVLAFENSASAEAVIRRGVAVAAAWITVTGAAIGALTYAAIAGVTIGHVGHSAATINSTVVATSAAAAASPSPEPSAVPGASARVTLTGMLTLDGAPLDAQFLGANVKRREGLRAACQLDIPPVAAGRYQINVLGDDEARGCGIDGAGIVLWTSVGDGIIFSRETIPWPGDGATATFDATFSSAAPDGAIERATELFGEARNRDGSRLPAGTVVEAYVAGVRCGVASTRGGAFEGFILIVAGPGSVSGCATGATITFRIDGHPAVESTPNDLNRGQANHEFNLTLK